MREDAFKRRIQRMKGRIPGSRTVVVKPYGGNDTWNKSYDAKHSEKRPLSLETQVMLGVEAEATMCSWVVWKNELPVTLAPLVKDDKIYDPKTGETWLVRRSGLQGMESRYHLDCVLVPS